MRHTLEYLLKRILIAIPTVVAVSLIGFFLMRFDINWGTHTLPDLRPGHWGNTISVELKLKNPIDPLAELKNNPQISQSVYESEKQRLGLDQPMHIQYWRWVSHLMHIDQKALQQGQFWRAWQPNLGKTLNGEDVATLLAARAGNTLLLNILVITCTWLLAIPLGVYAALHWRGFADRALTLLTSAGMAAPIFVVALVAAVICVRTGILPVGGLTSPQFHRMDMWHKILDVLAHLTLPVLILTFGGIASLQRQMRGNLLDVLHAEYVRLARAKGLPEHKVIYKHAVRTAINPLVTMFGYEFAALLSGSLLVEMILSYPGLGQFIYSAVLSTDTNVVMASLVMSSVLLILGNLLADVLLTWVDPRIELSR